MDPERHQGVEGVGYPAEIGLSKAGCQQDGTDPRYEKIDFLVSENAI